MLHILNGEDVFRRGEALHALRLECEAAAGGLGQTSRYDVRESSGSLSEIMTACQTAGFFSESRLIIVDNLLAKFGGKRSGSGRARRSPRSAASDEPPSEMGGVVGALKNLPETTTVVLVDDVPDTNPLLKALAPIAKVQTFAYLWDNEFGPWFEARAKDRGVKFTAAARNRILRLIDREHVGELAQEIDKLALYCGDRPVEVSDVDAMVSAAQSYKIWDLTDAVGEGRRETALRVSQELLDAKQTAATLQVFMLTRHFRQLLLLQAYLADGISQAEAAARAGASHQRVVKKLLGQVPRFAPGDLEEAYRRLLETDTAIKGGLVDEETALCLLINDLATLGGKRPALSLRP